MHFNPKEAWASIGRLTGGESSHHTSPKLMQMRIPSGNLAENDEERFSVFANHFNKILNNHKPKDTTVKKRSWKNLTTPPLWTEYICAIQEFTHDTSPGINGVPPNAFKSMSEENLRHHFNFITEFWEGKVNFE